MALFFIVILILAIILWVTKPTPRPGKIEFNKEDTPPLKETPQPEPVAHRDTTPPPVAPTAAKPSNLRTAPPPPDKTLALDIFGFTIRKIAASLEVPLQRKELQVRTVIHNESKSCDLLFETARFKIEMLIVTERLSEPGIYRVKRCDVPDNDIYQVNNFISYQELLDFPLEYHAHFAKITKEKADKLEAEQRYIDSLPTPRKPPIIIRSDDMSLYRCNACGRSPCSCWQ